MFLVAFALFGADATEDRIWCSRGFFLSAAGSLILFGLADKTRLAGWLRGIFDKPTGPLNLALCRVFFFSLFLSKVQVPSVLDPAMLVPPIGLGGLLKIMPMEAHLAAQATTLLRISCWFAILGFFTRSSALVSAVLGFYVLGIPNFYGKVDHGNHHLIWFAIVFAASQAGDYLSIDSVIRTWRRFGSSEGAAPKRSVAYARPLAALWILLGGVYFFPGFWKLWSAGLDWALSDNLALIMYKQWVELGRVPSFRPDRYPILLHLAGLGTLAFEIGFPLLVLFRRTRLPLAAAGIAFHTAIEMMLWIPFRTLSYCYFVLVDWEDLRNRLWRAMGVSLPAFRVETGGDRLSRLAAVAEPLDLLGLLEFHHRPNRFGLRIQRMGSKRLGSGSIEARSHDSRSAAPLSMQSAVHGFLILMVTVFGFGDISSAWPFSVYPTFAGLMSSNTTSTLEFEALNSKGERIPTDKALRRLKAALTGRWRNRLAHTLKNLTADSFRLEILGVWKQLSSYDQALERAELLRVFVVTEFTNPDDWPRNPASRKLVFEMAHPSGEARKPHPSSP